MNIPIEWIEKLLLVVAFFGLALGMFSLVLPAQSIRLYQGIMHFCNWRVEPLDYQRELRNTRVLGTLLALLGLLTVTARLRPEWFLVARLPFAGLFW